MSLFGTLKSMVSAMKDKSGTKFSTLNGHEFKTIRDEVLIEQGITPESLLGEMEFAPLKGITFYRPDHSLPLTEENAILATAAEDVFEVA